MIRHSFSTRRGARATPRACCCRTPTSSRTCARSARRSRSARTMSRELAAAVSRHGIDWPVAGRAVLSACRSRSCRRWPFCRDRRAGCGRPCASRHDLGRAQFCVRPVRPQDHGREISGSRSQQLARRGERIGGGQPGHNRSLYAPLRAVRIQSRVDVSRVRPRRIVGRAHAGRASTRSPRGPHRA